MAKLAQGAGSGATILLGPLVSDHAPGNRTGSPVALEMFQGEAKTFSLTVLDANNVAVDLSAPMLLRFVVLDVNGNGVFDVEDGAITRSGTSNKIAGVAVTAVQSAVAAENLLWRLLDIRAPTAPQVLLHGGFGIKTSVTDVA